MDGQSAGNRIRGVQIYPYFGSSETIRHALEDQSVSLGSRRGSLEEFNKDLYWAIGLFEAEGSLWVGDDRICISLCQSTKNIKILYKVKAIIGLGKVRVRKDSRYSDWKLTSGYDKVVKFISLINGRLITKKYNTRLIDLIDFINTKYSTNIQYFGPAVLTCNNAWLTGFVEGDGNFNVQIRPHTIGIRISITQKERDILDLINEFFPGSISASNNPRPHFKYSAGSISTRNGWIRYFTKFSFKGYKNIQYIRWLKCHRLVIQGLHRTDKGLARIKVLNQKDI
uniref:LAGLIDADG protein n=1 Tax=Porifera sp. TaxID=3140030 RepID=A0AAU8HP28_9METZ